MLPAFNACFREHFALTAIGLAFSTSCAESWGAGGRPRDPTSLRVILECLLG